MFSESVISLQGLGKCYQIYDKPRDRLLQMLVRRRKQYFREFWALNHIDLEIKPREVIGVIGRNGSGKSTLLQLVCGTLHPTIGQIKVKGRIAALLELGAGFNPEFTGRENVYLSAALSGMSQREIQDRFEKIVDFSGMRDFIDQPVKTYSSGMYVRLAFSVAINVDPDILVIDEALSVGDGEFARKSFEQIMAMKDAGKTILFCSHSLYQVEAICDRVIWLDKGIVRLTGEPAKVVVNYRNEINAFSNAPKVIDAFEKSDIKSSYSGAISKVSVAVDGVISSKLTAISRQSSVDVTVEFISDKNLPAPTVAVGFTLMDGTIISGTSTHIDNILLQHDENGRGGVTISFEKIPLLKGQYLVVVYLMCERGIHVYDHSLNCAVVNVMQGDLEQGIFSIEHNWRES